MIDYDVIETALDRARTDPAPMAEKPTYTIAELVAKLDPDRDYGERSYQDILDGVSSGAIVIRPGNNLPQLWFNNRTIKGTGQPPLNGVSAQQKAVHRFRELGLDDVDWAYQNLRNGMSRGDPRYDKIWWEYMGGKMGESKGGEAMAEAFKALLSALEKPEQRTVIIDQ